MKAKRRSYTGPLGALIFILLIAAILRFFRLGAVPMGITHDEMGYIYNAYSIAKTGRNVFGQAFPLFTWMTQGGFPFMPVPIYSMVPLFFLFPLTPFVARFLPALLGVLDVFLLFYIVRSLFRDTALALVSALFLAISPWQLHFARSAYDANFALFWYLAGIALFFHAEKAKKRPWLWAVAFIAAVYSYRGMSMLFLPVALLLVWYARAAKRMQSRHYAVFVAGLAAACLLFVLPVLTFGHAYTAEGTALFQNPKIQSDVDRAIRESQGPLLLRRLFINKPNYIVTRFRENYLKEYSPEFLFLYTEPDIIYSIWTRGRLYFADAAFILLGIWYLLRKHNKEGLLWIGLTLVGGLPGGIGGLPYSSRNFFLAAVFPVLSAAGAVALVRASRNRWFIRGAVFLVALVYLYSTASYLFDYYDRYAYQSAEGWAKSIKEISTLAKTESSTHDLVYMSNTSFGDAVQYAFWNNVNPVTVQQSWSNRRTQPYGYNTLSNVVFSQKCIDQHDLTEPPLAGNRTVYYIDTHTCNNDATPSAKIEDYYGNPIWKLFDLNLKDPDTTNAL